MDRIPNLVAMLWAGALLGGSFIAAPAKFTVSTLTTEQLLAVGRAQFHALALAEYVLAALLLIALWGMRPSRWWLGFIPVVILAEQQLMIMPALDERTLARIAEETVGDSHLHLIYVVLEGLKFASLLALSVYWRAPTTRG